MSLSIGVNLRKNHNFFFKANERRDTKKEGGQEPKPSEGYETLKLGKPSLLVTKSALILEGC